MGYGRYLDANPLHIVASWQADSDTRCFVVRYFIQDGKGGKEGNVLFNDALNTFYVWLYGVRHMVKDHSDSERGNPLQPHRILFPINSKGSFICIIPRPLLHQSSSTGWNEK